MRSTLGVFGGGWEQHRHNTATTPPQSCDRADPFYRVEHLTLLSAITVPRHHTSTGSCPCLQAQFVIAPYLCLCSSAAIHLVSLMPLCDRCSGTTGRSLLRNAQVCYDGDIEPLSGSRNPHGRSGATPLFRLSLRLWHPRETFASRAIFSRATNHCRAR